MDPITIADLRASAPVLILFATGLVVLVADLFRRPRPGQGAGAAASSCFDGPPMSPYLHLVAASGAFLAGVAVLAGWEQAAGFYFNGSIRVELFSRALSGVIILGAFLTSVCAASYLRRRGIEDGEFHALVLLSAGAMVLLVESNTLLMIFLSLETLSIAAYVLAGFTRGDKRSVEGALKYLVLGGFASGFLLLGLALMFGATAELRLDAMGARLAAGQADLSLLLAGAALTIVGFAFKLGAFPFHSWLPDAYEGAPTLVTGFMAVTVKTAAIAALTRVMVVLFGEAPAGQQLQSALTWVLSALAIGTMVFGNLVALVQSSVKRTLAYSGIAHTGYLLIGVVAARSPGQHGSAIVFYLLPYALMTFGAFAVLAVLPDGHGDAETFDSLRGLSRRKPLLAFAMLVFMVSLAGIPPTAGFWAKLYLFREAVETGHWPLALVGILTSIAAVYYYLRVVVMMYLQPVPAGAAPAAATEAAPAGDASAWAAPAAIAFAAAAVIVVGLYPNPLLEQSVSSIQSLYGR